VQAGRPASLVSVWGKKIPWVSSIPRRGNLQTTVERIERGPAIVARTGESQTLGRVPTVKLDASGSKTTTRPIRGPDAPPSSRLWEDETPSRPDSKGRHSTWQEWHQLEMDDYKTEDRARGQISGGVPSWNDQHRTRSVLIGRTLGAVNARQHHDLRFGRTVLRGNFSWPAGRLH